MCDDAGTRQLRLKASHTLRQNMHIQAEASLSLPCLLRQMRVASTHCTVDLDACISTGRTKNNLKKKCSMDTNKHINGLGSITHQRCVEYLTDSVACPQTTFGAGRLQNLKQIRNEEYQQARRWIPNYSIKSTTKTQQSRTQEREGAIISVLSFGLLPIVLVPTLALLLTDANGIQTLPSDTHQRETSIGVRMIPHTLWIGYWLPCGALHFYCKNYSALPSPKCVYPRNNRRSRRHLKI